MQLKAHIYEKIDINSNNEYDRLNKTGNKSNATEVGISDTESVSQSVPLSCLDWSSNEEIYYSDDHRIYKQNTSSRESGIAALLPSDFIPTDMHWLLMGGKCSGGGKGNDTLLICSNDGRFIILNKSLRVERSIAAHFGAITSGRWSPDGAGLLTAGEDGVIKIWSRSGMLRSTVLQAEEAITCARWSSNSDCIVFSQGGHISVKPLAANSKRIRWQAHEGMVLSLSWSSQSSQSHLIASGGEDMRYKIWNSQGLHLFTSTVEDQSITMVSFNNEKDLLLVGGFNMMKLCSTAGWCYHTNRFNEPSVGSILLASWSADGTQVCCGTFNGRLIVGHLVQQQIIRRNLKATTVSSKSLHLEDLMNSSSDVLDFTERIINFALGYGHLIVATSNQVHIYNEKYINTPIIIDGRTGTKAIEVGKKFFMILDSTSVWIYTHTGRLHLNPRYPGSQAQIPLLDSRSLSLGFDLFIIKDCSDSSSELMSFGNTSSPTFDNVLITAMHIFNLIPGATRQFEPFTLKVSNPITKIKACRAGTVDDQFIVMIDINRELYIMESPNINGTTERSHSLINRYKEICKIGTQVTDVHWASESNILVGVHDLCYSVWYCPGEGAGDPTIIALTTVTLDATEFGKDIMIESFEDAIITLRCSGTLIPVNINIYCDILHRCLAEGQWVHALNICRLVRNPYLWATLAAVAARKNQLQISEEAYSAALQIDKVSYLQYLKSFDATSAEYMAENSLVMGRQMEAQTILLNSGKYREAVALSLRLHNLHKALEIAQKYVTSLLDEVLEQRGNYLKALGKKECDPIFLNVIETKNKNSSD